MKALLGKKIGMTQLFQSDKVIPVTLVEAGPCTITQTKTEEKDGYVALQLGFGEFAGAKKATKSNRKKPFVFLREFRGTKGDFVNGEERIVDVSVFTEGERVQVSGISKGKGFQGAVRRHGFAGRNSSHGVKHEQRTLGSTGTSFPERVIKGRRMPGRMGGDRVTVKNLTIAKVDKEHNVLAIQGAIPGPRGTLLEILGI